MIRTWCEAMERADARLRLGDIEKALGDYKKSTRKDAEVIYLNAKMIKRVGEAVPEDIQIIEHDGVASWEVWMDGGDNLRGFLPPEIPKPPKLAEDIKIPPSPTVKPTADATKSKSNPLQNSSSVSGRGIVLKHIKKSLDVSKKHPGGRPRKTVGYSRVTDWRRRKEQQGVLL